MPLNVGSPTSGFKEWEATQTGWKTTSILFHGFVGLTTARGEIVDSPEFTCFGHQWKVGIYPGGCHGSEVGMVAIYLMHWSEKSIDVNFKVGVKDKDGRDVVRSKSRRYLVKAPDIASIRGYKNCAERSDILKALVAGTLVMEVEMKYTDPRVKSAPFIGENPSRDMLRDLHTDETSADVVFEVADGGQEINSNGKRSRTSNVVRFFAHKLILKRCAPMLAALCPAGADPVSVVAISDVAPGVFRHMLSYFYGGDVDEDGYKSHAKEILEAADRYELVSLKLEAEAEYIRSNQIDFENVMELLLYSDSKNLALLKEAVMEFIVDNGDEVLQKVSLKDAPGGVLADLVAAVSRKTNGDADNHKLGSMRISDLRKKLHEKGLGIDGSREMLVAALESA